MNLRPLFAHSHGFRTYGVPTPAADYALQASYTSNAAQHTYTLPGLPSAAAVTVFLVFNKDPAAEDLYMVCAIQENGTQNLTDLCYSGRQYTPNYGFGLNTYNSGFTTFDDRYLLDNARTIIVSATLYNNDYTRFTMRLNGAPAAFTLHPSHSSRPFSDQFILGGGIASQHKWRGDILDCYVYLRELSGDDQTQTETYLLNKYSIT